MNQPPMKQPPMKQPLAFGVITIFVRNMARARTFYTEVLDLEVVEELVKGSFLVLRPFRGPLITLQFDVDLFGPVAKPQGYEIGLIVENMDELWERWQPSMATVLVQPHEFPLGRTFVGLDPDGHRLRIYELKPGFGFTEDAAVERVMAALHGELDKDENPPL